MNDTMFHLFISERNQVPGYRRLHVELSGFVRYLKRGVGGGNAVDCKELRVARMHTVRHNIQMKFSSYQL